MKFATLKDGSVVIVTEKGITSLKDLGFELSMKDLIIDYDYLSTEIVSHNTSPKVIEDGYTFDAPLKNPGKIVAIGLNYKDHANESKMEAPKFPLVFSKFPSSIIGSGDEIEFSRKVTERVDYEVELAVIIGKYAKEVPVEKALEYVFGYTVINDVSARDIQFSESQWVRAKSLDTFCPLGPIIVTKDELPDPQNINLSCEVNNAVMQNDNTSNMIFGVAELISKLSYSFTFEPGDIIATGTPSGVGFSRKPPVYLKHGDIVKAKIKGIGELTNKVIEK